MKENDVYKLTLLPKGKTTISGRWVYKIKENPDGSPKYKARFVAKGYNQTKGVDYTETFSPTADITSIRILMQVAIQYNLIVH